MRWIRSNVRWGAWCALFALAVQLTLSFGHVHVIGTAGSLELALAASPLSSDTANPASNPDPNGQAGEFCAVCALIQLAGAMALATTPVLVLPFVFSAAPFAFSADSNLAAASPLFFQARAPPIA